MPGQQAGRFGRRHAEGLADRGRRRDAAVVQLPADQHAQANGLQSVFVPEPPFRGGLLRLCGWRWRRLVGEQAHVGQLGTVVRIVTPTALVLSSPPDGADGKDEDVDEAAKGEADTETEGEP
jgi:hypothetical protein